VTKAVGHRFGSPRTGRSFPKTVWLSNIRTPEALGGDDGLGVRTFCGAALDSEAEILRSLTLPQNDGRWTVGGVGALRGGGCLGGFAAGPFEGWCVAPE